MSGDTIRTRAQFIADTPVEGMTDQQVVDAAAIVVGDINAVTGIRGPGVPERGIYDHDIAQVLRVVANFPDRHAAAIQRAAQLGYPWTAAAQERNEQIMTAYIAGIDDQPRIPTTDVDVPAMNLDPRPDFVHLLGEDGLQLYDASLAEIHEGLIPKIAATIMEHIPIAAADMPGVMRAAGHLASSHLHQREIGSQFGFDAADVEHQLKLDQLRMQGPEGRGGSY